jgi:hypothetical protein
MLHPRLALIKPSGKEGEGPPPPPLFIVNLQRRPDRLARLLSGTLHWPGEVWRYEAIDAHSDEGLVYAKSLDANLENWSVWQRGIGGYGNRFSHVDLLTTLLHASDYPHFMILEDDVELLDGAALNSLGRHVLALLKAKDADLFVCAGWDYKPKRALSVKDFFSPRGAWMCYCTLATQCNLYSRRGARRLVDLSSLHPGIHLDEVVARLQVSNQLFCVGLRRNPLRCFLSVSDVEYANIS